MHILNLLQSLLCCLSCFLSCILMGMLSCGKFASKEKKEELRTFRSGLTEDLRNGNILFSCFEITIKTDCDTALLALFVVHRCKM